MNSKKNLMQSEFSRFFSWEPSLEIPLKKRMRRAEKAAVALFSAAAERVPAYSDFLKQAGVSPGEIRRFVDFQNVPPTTKENYVQRYSLADRAWDGDVTSGYQLSMTSGTTGSAMIWPQGVSQVLDGARTHEYIFQALEIQTNSTLFINGFALGPGVAGTFTLLCAFLANVRGYRLTSVQAGYSLEEVLRAYRQAAHFEQVVITGFVPFLKEVAEAVLLLPDDMHAQRLILLGTGQTITERYRTYIEKLFEGKGLAAEVLNVYGSTDAALMGFETTSSIALRKVLSDTPELAQTLFGETRVPSLYQFDPEISFFESLAGELHITKNGASPLIRYNMHDEGGVLLPNHFSKAIELPADAATNNSLPYVYLYGRDKFMIKLFGANIYSEHVQQALVHEHIASYVSGRYHLELEIDQEHSPHFVLHLELVSGQSAHEDLVRQLVVVLQRELCQINQEYKVVCREFGEKAYPVVKLYSNGDPEKFPLGKILKHA